MLPKNISDTQILSLLELDSPWGRRVCETIIARKETFTPLLLRILDDTIEKMPLYEEDGNEDLGYTFTPALFLLAQLREPLAFPKLIRLMSVETDSLMDALWGDVLTDNADALLRDTFNGDLETLKRFIENRAISPWPRIKAIEALRLLFVDGHISRDALVEYYRTLINQVYPFKKRAHNDELVIGSLILAIEDSCLAELTPDIKAVFDAGFDDSFVSTYPRFLEMVGSGVVKNEPHIDSAYTCLRRMSWFRAPNMFGNDTRSLGFDEGASSDDELNRDPERNDPCPCGSGKKYKKCCMNK